MSAPTRRIRVAAESDLREGVGLLVTAENQALALFLVEGRCYAISNACPHMGGPLCDGPLKDHVVTCPWHGWKWDVRTGDNVRNPRLRKVACFPVTVDNGDVFIEMP